MALGRRSAKKPLGFCHILRHAPAELVGLPQVKQGIGVPVRCGGFPFRNRCGKFTPGPGIDSCLDVGQRWPCREHANAIE